MPVPQVALLAAANGSQIQGKAGQSVSVFPLVARGYPPRSHNKLCILSQVVFVKACNQKEGQVSVGALLLRIPKPFRSLP